MAYENVPKQKNSRVVIILVVLALGAVPCIGIVAAISIPAFLQYINLSKAAEATTMVNSIALQVEDHFARNCELPPSLPPLADVNQCCYQERCSVDNTALAVWSAAGIQVDGGPFYFVYETEYRADSTYAVRAIADVSCSGPPNHTYELILEPDYGECILHRQAPTTRDEFW